MATKFWEAHRGAEAVGVVGARYVPARPGRERHVVIEGLVVFEQYRGSGLQNPIRELAIKSLRGPRARGKITVKSYVHVENVASMRNLVKSGFLPTGLFDGCYLTMQRD